MNEELAVAILRALDSVRTDLARLTPETQLYTDREAAKLLGVSADTVRRLCDTREIDYVQAAPGHAKRISSIALRDWVARHTVSRLRA